MDARIDLTGLTATERELLRLGVTQWQRAGDGRWDEAARLLNFADASELRSDVARLAALLAKGGPMLRLDVRRVLLATELAYVSETLGWSRDWSADTGFPDRETISLLRNVQEKLAGVVHGPDTSVRSSARHEDPAWVPIPMDLDDEYWTPFERNFRFRPRYSPATLAITEPRPSVTLDLKPIFTSGHGEFAAGENAVNSLALLAFVRTFDEDTSLIVLDWQHQTYRLWPHRLARQLYPRWETEVFPNGDYYIFLTDDLAAGTFGHPWEQTLCVFGEPLVTTLAPLLTTWLPIKRDNR